LVDRQVKILNCTSLLLLFVAYVIRSVKMRCMSQNTASIKWSNLTFGIIIGRDLAPSLGGTKKILCRPTFSQWPFVMKKFPFSRWKFLMTFF